MFIPTSKNQALLIEELSKKPHTTESLIAFAEQKKISQSGTYRALEKLREKEIVFQSQNSLTLHPQWLASLTHFSDKAHTSNKLSQSIEQLLKNKKRRTLSFHSLEELLKTWDFYFSYLISRHQAYDICYAYSPYDWFTLINSSREQKSDYLSESLKKIRIESFGFITLLGKELKKSFETYSFIKSGFTEKPLSPDKNYYVNIFGETLIEAFIPSQATEYIENLFADHQKIKEIDKEKVHIDLQEILSKHKSRLVISHNPKKALLLSKRISKDFFIN